MVLRQEEQGWCASCRIQLKELWPPWGAQAEELGSESRELKEGGVRQLGAGTKNRTMTWPLSPRLSSLRWPGVREEQGMGCWMWAEGEVSMSRREAPVLGQVKGF